MSDIQLGNDTLHCGVNLSTSYYWITDRINISSELE